jgi:hypothetical protein
MLVLSRQWLPADANPYYYYDLDWILTFPNMDPHILPFEIISENNEEVVVKTGFGAIVRKKFVKMAAEVISGRVVLPDKTPVEVMYSRWRGAGRDDVQYLSHNILVCAGYVGIPAAYGHLATAAIPE